MNNNNTTNIFVYGTLMDGQRAHYILDGCTFLGTYLLRDYAMYHLSNYPGILKEEGKSVIGEVYTIPQSLLPRMDEYECEGSLYHRRTVTVTRGSEQLDVQAYIYAREVDPNALMQEPWNRSDDDFVWYACYGSNLSSERFACYIEGGVCKWNSKEYDGTKDKTPPRTVCNRSYPGRLYFANSSKSWHGSSVAFFDPTPVQPSDLVHMRLYKISRAQLAGVQEQEGKCWYSNIHCLEITEDGIPVYTLTSDYVRVPSAPPSRNYRECILCGLIETSMTPEDAEIYLNKWL